MRKAYGADVTGTWVLIVIVHTGLYQIATLNLDKFTDLGFSYYQCQSAKESYNRTLVQKYRFECVRESEI